MVAQFEDVCQYNSGSGLLGCFRGSCQNMTTEAGEFGLRCVCSNEWFTHSSLVFLLGNCNQFVFLHEILCGISTVQLLVGLFLGKKCLSMKHKKVEMLYASVACLLACVFGFLANFALLWTRGGANPLYGLCFVIMSTTATCSGYWLFGIFVVTTSKLGFFSVEQTNKIMRKFKHTFFGMAFFLVGGNISMAFTHVLLYCEQIDAKQFNQLGFMMHWSAFVANLNAYFRIAGILDDLIACLANKSNDAAIFGADQAVVNAAIDALRTKLEGYRKQLRPQINNNQFGIIVMTVFYFQFGTFPLFYNDLNGLMIVCFIPGFTLFGLNFISNTSKQDESTTKQEASTSMPSSGKRKVLPQQ